MEFIQKEYHDNETINVKNTYHSENLNNKFIIKKKIGYFGIELHNFDIHIPENLSLLPDLLDEHLVVIIKNSKITYEEQIQLVTLFGRPTLAHPVVPGNDDFPQVLEIDGSNGGKNAKWHTDVTFLENPHSVSVLTTDIIPEAGGDTLWCDLRTAYNDISNGLKEYINKLEAVHKITPLAYWGDPFHYLNSSNEKILKIYELSKKVPPVIHPVVRIHPKTKQPSFFVNPGYTSHILNVSRIESENILKLIYDHMTQPEYILRHKWEPNDIVIWDNQCTAHYAVNNYGKSKRKMIRVTAEGEKPYGYNGLYSKITQDPLEIER